MPNKSKDTDKKKGVTRTNKPHKKKRSVVKKTDKFGFKKGERRKLWKATQHALSIALLRRGIKAGKEFNKYASLIYAEILKDKDTYKHKKDFKKLLEFVTKNSYQVVTQTLLDRFWIEKIKKGFEGQIPFWALSTETVKRLPEYQNVTFVFQSFSDGIVDLDYHEEDDIFNGGEWFDENILPICREHYNNSPYALLEIADYGEDPFTKKKFIEFRLITDQYNEQNHLKYITPTKDEVQYSDVDSPKNEPKVSSDLDIEREKTKQMEAQAEIQKQISIQSKEETKRKALDAFLSGKISEETLNLLIK